MESQVLETMKEEHGDGSPQDHSVMDVKCEPVDDDVKDLDSSEYVMKDDTSETESLLEPLCVPMKSEQGVIELSEETVEEENVDTIQTNEDMESSGCTMKGEVDDAEVLMEPLFVPVEAEPYSEGASEESSMEENFEATENEAIQDHTQGEAWLEVRKIMEAEIQNQLTLEDQNRGIRNCKPKWKRIRDNYMRLKEANSGDRLMKKRKNVYAKAPKFHRSSLEKGNSTLETDEDEEHFSPHSLGSPGSDTEKRPSKPSTSSNFEPTHCWTPWNKGNASKSKMTVFQHRFLEKVDDILGKPLSNDPDKRLLMSFLPFVKNLCEEEKLDFHQHVLQFFLDKRQKRDQGIPSHRPPPHVFHVSCSIPPTLTSYQPTPYEHLSSYQAFTEPTACSPHPYCAPLALSDTH